MKKYRSGVLYEEEEEKEKIPVREENIVTGSNYKFPPNKDANTKCTLIQ